jgi:two-component system, response regulator / RNA-binding antiterminator
MTLRVLIVDDNSGRGEAVAEALRAEGCDVAGVVPDRIDLIEQVRATQADVIVCALDAASRDTIESMSALNRDEPRPVVMFVDKSEPGRIEEAMQAGVAAYVIEGLAPNRVKPVIDVAMARFRAHQQLQGQLHEAQSALAERKLLDRAKLILMKTRKMSEDEAHRTLRRLAMEQGKKLREVAESVISLSEMIKK